MLKQLRTIHYQLDLLKYTADHTELDEKIARMIDELVESWEPVRAELAEKQNRINQERNNDS